MSISASSSCRRCPRISRPSAETRPLAAKRARRKLAEPAHAEADEAGRDEFEAEAAEAEADPWRFPPGGRGADRPGSGKCSTGRSPAPARPGHDRARREPSPRCSRSSASSSASCCCRRPNCGVTARRARRSASSICSPHPGEGKTYCAVNLALSIAAEKESEVLLVDADFAKPSVLSTLGLPGGPG